jgi:hypothetical protein
MVTLIQKNERGCNSLSHFQELLVGHALDSGFGLGVASPRAQ